MGKSFYKCNNKFFSLWVHQLHWIPSAIGVWADARIFVRHRVDGDKKAGKSGVVVTCSEVVKACF